MREKRLVNLLRLEVADKSIASSLAFSTFCVYTYFYKFNCVRFASIIEVTSLLLILANISRLVLTRRINQVKKITDNEWRILQFMIWGNALGWSVILNTAAFELKLQGTHFIIVTTLVAGFIGSSIVTLAYFASLFLPFQILLLVPQVFIILYYYFSEGINLLPMIFMYVMYLLYQVKQYQVFRREILKRFSYQYDLELANDKLKSSKDELINQTVKLVHVSRLAALGEMSAGIAHEINNPLTIIKGGAQLIEKNISKENIERELILKQSQKIQNSVNRVTKIVQGLKSFSNMSDNKPKEEVAVKDIIEDTLGFCNEVLASHGIRLDLDNIPDCRLLCHPVQISQVLINLIKNAQDEILEKDTVESDRWINLKFEIKAGNLLIYVINGGARIRPELMDKIFNPFFSTKPIGKGTGLGLSISQKIMREHLGDLTIDHSMPYTTFVVTHPILSA